MEDACWKTLYPHARYAYRSNPEEESKVPELRSIASPEIAPQVRPGTPTLSINPMSGISVVDSFKMDMIWATNYPPLNYRYEYAEVPISLIRVFEDARNMGKTPVERRNATTFLATALKPIRREMRSWSYASDMATTFPIGRFLIVGRAYANSFSVICTVWE